MKANELIKYELPPITEYISNRWLQGLIGKYYGRKVIKKLERYKKRLQREEWLNIINSHR